MLARTLSEHEASAERIRALLNDLETLPRQTEDVFRRHARRWLALMRASDDERLVIPVVEAWLPFTIANDACTSYLARVEQQAIRIREFVAPPSMGAKQRPESAHLFHADWSLDRLRRTSR